MVETSILNKLSNVIGKNSIGLYHDDGLGVFDKSSGPQIEQWKKKIKILKTVNFSIRVTSNITSLDFLDATLNLKIDLYQSFRKPNNDPIYIDGHSNRPPQILKKLPKSISKRLLENSSSKEVFDNPKTLYETSLNNNVFNKHLLCYQDEGNKNQNKIKNRQRKMTWFNPPFSKFVKTNIGKKFCKLINRHFPKHKMSRIFNKNTRKLSYSCCKNIGFP